MHQYDSHAFHGRRPGCQFRASRNANVDVAFGVLFMAGISALRSEGSALAQSRSLRSFSRARVHAFVELYAPPNFLNRRMGLFGPPDAGMWIYLTVMATLTEMAIGGVSGCLVSLVLRLGSRWRSLMGCATAQCFSRGADASSYCCFNLGVESHDDLYYRLVWFLSGLASERSLGTAENTLNRNLIPGLCRFQIGSFEPHEAR
jgi:hypothetical protein